MSKVDKVFGNLAAPLIAKWGQPMVFVRVDGSGQYDPDTGVVTPNETRYEVKAVITNVDPEEYGGLYQTTDIKIMIDPQQIDDHFITVEDRFEIPKAGKTEIAKVVFVEAYRGEKPVFFQVIAKPQ